MCRFDPARPDGENDSLRSAISPDGTPEPGREYRVPARCGVAVRLAPGRRLTVINIHGTQVGDFWAFNAENMEEHLSLEHVRIDLRALSPGAGDRLVSNRRRPILTIEEDTAGAPHDTLVAACDAERYRQLGAEGWHDNCTDNLRLALIAIGLRAPAIPAPLNLWMQVPVGADGRLDLGTTGVPPGARVVFRAELPMIAVISACPMDLFPLNGPDGVPRDLAFVVE